ncbi:MAG TPA: hypothetical protein VKN82_02220 [Desulfohalobiaceae bacterium]|nr:hypothetical protein [Desulfohalobiaceae bacterium]
MNHTEVDRVKKLLGEAIQRLRDIQESIVVENIDQYDIQLNLGRKLDPIYHGAQAIGFQQVSGDVFSIVIEDRSRKGKLSIK